MTKYRQMIESKRFYESEFKFISDLKYSISTKTWPVKIGKRNFESRKCEKMNDE